MFEELERNIRNRVPELGQFAQRLGLKGVRGMQYAAGRAQWAASVVGWTLCRAHRGPYTKILSNRCRSRRERLTTTNFTFQLDGKIINSRGTSKHPWPWKETLFTVGS